MSEEDKGMKVKITTRAMENIEKMAETPEEVQDILDMIRDSFEGKSREEIEAMGEEVSPEQAAEEIGVSVEELEEILSGDDIPTEH